MQFYPGVDRRGSPPRGAPSVATARGAGPRPRGRCRVQGEAQAGVLGRVVRSLDRCSGQLLMNFPCGNQKSLCEVRAPLRFGLDVRWFRVLGPWCVSLAPPGRGRSGVLHALATACTDTRKVGHTSASVAERPPSYFRAMARVAGVGGPPKVGVAAEASEPSGRPAFRYFPGPAATCTPSTLLSNTNELETHPRSNFATARA